MAGNGERKDTQQKQHAEQNVTVPRSLLALTSRNSHELISLYQPSPRNAAVAARAAVRIVTLSCNLSVSIGIVTPLVPLVLGSHRAQD